MLPIADCVGHFRSLLGIVCFCSQFFHNTTTKKDSHVSCFLSKRDLQLIFDFRGLLSKENQLKKLEHLFLKHLFLVGCPTFTLLTLVKPWFVWAQTLYGATWARANTPQVGIGVRSFWKEGLNFEIFVSGDDLAEGSDVKKSGFKRPCKPVKFRYFKRFFFLNIKHGFP